MTELLRPKYFIVGIFIGFVSCCIAGHLLSSKARLEHFTRFFHHIQPQTQYYPTAHELLNTAHHKVKLDKILVLIGGSSILRGEGQKADELWSDELQRLLGNNFKVLNFAMDSANLTSFASVIFRILKEEYPKIIFVSTCFPEIPGSIEGTGIFTYLFWDAYYKGLLHLDSGEIKTVQQIRRNQMLTPAGAEQHFLSYLDSILYFRNLWNWVGYRLVFTVWSDITARHSYKPRRTYKDVVNDEVKASKKKKHVKKKSHFPESVKILASIISNCIDFSKEKPQFDGGMLISVRQSLDDAFSPPYRSKILCLIPSENPRHLSALPIKFQQAHPLVINNIRDLSVSLGYHGLDIGQDFSPKDFADARHFSGSGGKKTAMQVAEKVRYIAAFNGYL